jgi:hypothetical protein
MTRKHKITVALAEGIAVHTAITATGIAALTVWARYCERRRHPA